MNIYPFRIFIGKEKRGEALKFVEQLKDASTFKRARFDVFVPKMKTEKVIVCLGQRHTVLRGKISSFGAKRIARVQARLFSYYRFFHHQFKVTAFGAEGVIANGKGSRFRYRDDLLNKYLLPREQRRLKAEDEDAHLNTVTRILKRLSTAWCKQMKAFGHDVNHGHKQIAPYAACVNGLRLYSYVADEVIYFPIEGESAYQGVASKVSHHQKEMIRLQKTMIYKSARLKKGKGLNNEEYEVLKSYNEHVKAFNKAIKSNYREKASFALSLKQLGVSGGIGPEGFAVTVFTMGIGHRTNYKWLAPRYLKRENVAFVLITAPELWWWKHITGWGLKVSALVAVLAGIGWWLLG